MIDNIKEDLLHYIWQTKNFDHKDLKTTKGQTLSITSFGHLNRNAGPDFLGARVEIDGTSWAGHIEIHLKSSDWVKHRHDLDHAYHNVILHVVMIEDMSIARIDKSVIPCLELYPLINHKLLGQYQYLQNNRAWIPCEQLISSVDEISRTVAKNRALVQRLTIKANKLESKLKSLGDDFVQLIYEQFAWAFGLKVNAESFCCLAQSIPYKIISKHKDNLLQLEALLFGQSGMIPDKNYSSYVVQLKREYNVLKHKFKLTPMSKVQWKFSTLRPAGFPTVRIALFAQFLHQTNRIEDLIFGGDLAQLNKKMEVRLTGYWQNHYRFNVPSSRKNKRLGKNTVSTIVINSVVPILFMYGQIRQNEIYKERAIELLDQLPPELNSITKRWMSLDMLNKTAADSQALIHLKSANCDLQFCLSCPIGHKIISKK